MGSMRALVVRLLCVFTLCLLLLGYYEFTVVLKPPQQPLVIQEQNLRFDNTMQQHLVSTSTLTVVSVGDITHFNYIYQQAVFWIGTLSVVISISKKDEDLLNSMVQSSLFPARVIVTPYENERDSFPINTLRNIGYNSVTSTHVLMLDLDVLPSPSLYSSFLSLPLSALSDDKLAIVLPLFEMNYYSIPCTNWYTCEEQNSHLFDLTKYDLKMGIMTGACRELGHNGVNQYMSSKWYSLPISTPLMPYQCWANLEQQPFVIVRHSTQVPQFYDKLVDHGRNRLEWINHLRYRGFHFSLLSHSWLYHLRHSSQELVGSRNYQNTMLYERRESELAEQYKGHWMIPLCSMRSDSQPIFSSSGMKLIEKLEREIPEREKIEHVKPEHEMSEHVKLEQETIEHVKPEQTRPEQGTLEQAKPELMKPELVRPERVRPRREVRLSRDEEILRKFAKRREQLKNKRH